MESTRPGSVTTVETALDVIELLRARDASTLTEIATELGMAKSTAHRHLSTLEWRGYVVRSGDNYRLSLKFLDIGEFTRTREPAYRLAESTVAEIAKTTTERAQFLVEENGRGVYVHVKSGQHAVRTNVYVGKHVDIHASAAGLAILSQFSDDRVDEIIDRHGLPKLTERTITGREELFEELATIRERGYSINDQGHIDGLRAIGAPVCDPDDEVIGGLSVSGPTHRMEGDRFETELPSLILGSANELELNIAYQ
ncbi:IclR family transcriptional regulator [Haloferacaceae archaeon DSL9]